MDKFKNNKLLIICLVITIIILSSCNFNVIKGLSDDNYSTYLYNQNINVDKDKAHLLSEESDGSNSYRNIFQSNFLFPAKLQSNMLSTSATSVFSHYSFNQFYFDNLDNSYAYKSNDNSENFIESIVPNDFEVEKGTNIVNGSLENQDSNFGKYNATYSFDDYQETESNYGYYDGNPYNFNNEVIGTSGNNIKWINRSLLMYGCNAIIESEYYNHKNVIKFNHDGGISDPTIYHDYEQTKSGIFEYYWIHNDVSDITRIRFSEIGHGNIIHILTYNDKIYFYNNSEVITEIQQIYDNVWYYFKVVLRDDNTFDLYVNGIKKVDNQLTNNNQINGINEVSLQYSSNINDFLCFDGFGNVNHDSYSKNDNTNPYALQTELENNNWNIKYNYGIECYIKNESTNYNNVLVMVDNTDINYLNFTILTFQSQISGTVEFSFKTNDTNQRNGIGFSSAYYLKFESNTIYYYDGSYHDLGFSTNNNTWYNLRFSFDCLSDTWNFYINDIYFGNFNFGSVKDSIDNINFFSGTTFNNFEFYIDNIDFNWTNGYYENRINDVIPLNDSNYNMYKSSSLNESFNIYANQDIDVNWNKAPITPPFEHYIKIDDYQDTSDAIFTTISNEIEQFGFENKTIEKNIKLIKISIYGAKSLALGANNLRICLFDGINYSEYKIFSFSNFGVIEWIDNYYFVNFNQENINDLEIKILAPTAGSGSNTYIYSLNLTSYYNANEVNLITEKNLEYNENGKPILNTLYYSMTNNINNNFNLSIYNYDLDSYYLIKEYSNNLTFNTYSFIFNESAYFRFNKFKLKIYSFNITNFNFYIDLLCLNITYIFPNSLGYHEIIAYNQRYDDSDVYKGYSRFELQIHNNSLKYRYSEINKYTDNYIYSWIEVNNSNIVINNIELQSHVRYGLNTLDVEIINFYYIIYINYDDDLTIEFIEQSRKELDCHKIKSSFNYTSFTRNYLNQTGIIGNYSYNTFKGCRSLYGLTSEIFHRYFTIPYFSDDIDVNIDIELPDDIISNPDEPIPPTDYYWSYETFRIEYHQTSNINIGNWSVDFKLMKSVSYQSKYFYQPESISKSDLGSWKWKIKFSDAFSYTVNFNFMRNALKTVLNLVLLFFQFIFYLVIASLSYFLMFIGTNIMVFIWNILVYHVFYALIFVLWYLYEGLFLLLDAIWLGLIWLYENYLIPFYIWLTEIAIPWLVEFIIIPAIAFTLTLVIWIITLGNVDFWTLYDTIHEQLLITSDIMIDVIMELIDNIVILIYFIALYLLLTLMCFLKHIICKARGYTNRSNSLYDSFEVYIYPILLFYNICIKIKELIAQWF